MNRILIALTGWVLLAAGVVQGDPLPGQVLGPAKNPRAFNSTAVVQTSVVLNTGGRAVAAGDVLVAAVIFDIDPGWHLNTHVLNIPPELGSPEFYFATDVTWPGTSDLPLRVDAARVQWPHAETIEVAFSGTPVAYEVYSGRAVVYLPIEVAADAAPGDVELELKLTYQSCDDQSCKGPVKDQPIRVTVPIRTLDELARQTPLTEQQDAALAELFAGFDPKAVGASETPPKDVRFDIFGYSFKVDAGSGLGFMAFLLVAMVGGFLLNLTPCVLPVIPIKIMGLSQSAGHRGRCLLLGGAMSLGVVAFWMTLALMIVSLTGFDAINALFQETWFTIGVGIVIAIMALGMCGLFSVGLPQFVYQFSPKHDTLVGSFFFGIMTAVLATPCTAPFMGSAAAWSLTQAGSTTVLTFAAIGFGMALPYLVLSAWPALVEKMPRVGPASELIKQVMGLLLLAAAAFFIGVGLAGYFQKPPQPVSLIYWWFVACFIAAAGGWLIWRTWRLTQRAGMRAGWTVVGVLFISGAILGGRQLTDRGPIDWIYYTSENFAEALAAGDVVVMDFTAEWCLNCKAMEHGVLFSDPVASALAAEDVTPIKVDITSQSNTAGRAMLKRTGEVSIPLLVVYAPGNGGGGQVVLKSSYYTAEQVIEAIREARDGFSDP